VKDLHFSWVIVTHAVVFCYITRILCDLFEITLMPPLHVLDIIG